MVWLFLALRLSLGRRRRAITSASHLRTLLAGHFLLLMQPAHLLLMMQPAHLLLMMLSGHLLLMMLSIHLLLMIHRVLPLSCAFVLDSFVVHPDLVSLNVVIVPVKIFSLVFGPLILGPKFLGVFFTAHSCSLAVMLTDVPRLVLSFPRSRTLKVTFIHVPRFVFSSRSCCSPGAPESLRAFALASAFVFVE